MDRPATPAPGPLNDPPPASATRADSRQRASARETGRPPKALKPLKARHADECERLEQLPNIGPSIAGDLRRLGVEHPGELAARDPYALYRALCEATGRRQDPCVLDTFIAAVDFMRGADPRPWWTYTGERKLRYGAV